jgi:hypothetical protein
MIRKNNWTDLPSKPNLDDWLALGRLQSGVSTPDELTGGPIR